MSTSRRKSAHGNPFPTPIEKQITIATMVVIAVATAMTIITLLLGSRTAVFLAVFAAATSFFGFVIDWMRRATVGTADMGVRSREGDRVSSRNL
jgi:hypothetical protein